MVRFKKNKKKNRRIKFKNITNEKNYCWCR